MPDSPDFDDLFSCMMGALTEDEQQENESEEEIVDDGFNSTELMQEVLNSILAMHKQLNNAEHTVSFGWMCGEALRKLLGFIYRQKDAPRAFRTIGERLRNLIKDSKLTDALLANYIHLADAFPDVRDIERLGEKISLDSLLYIARLKSDLQRIYYSERAWNESWSANRLRKAVREDEFTKDFGDEG